MWARNTEECLCCSSPLGLDSGSGNSMLLVRIDSIFVLRRRVLSSGIAHTLLQLHLGWWPVVPLLTEVFFLAGRMRISKKEFPFLISGNLRT